MNAVLFERDEIGPDGVVELDGRRAAHLREVLGVAPGRTLRVGILDGPLGRAEVHRVRDDRVTLACTFDAPPPPVVDVLILAAPRPKVLGRCLEAAAALGFAAVAVVRTWRTDKAHLRSGALAPAAIDHRLRLGLEQAVRTQRPRVTVEPLFRPFVEDRLPELAAGTARRTVAHPDGAVDVAALPPEPGPFAIAIGPERGFTDYEVAAFAAKGFVPTCADHHPLRVETALVAVTASLGLLRRAARAERGANA